jgi:hypothetical protein
VRPYATTHDIAKDGSIKNSGRPAYNERMSDRLPMGSRGGGVLDYYARAGGTYEVAGWLNANTNNEADRMTEDRVSLKVPLKAGAHTIGLAFRHTIAPDESVQTLRNTTDKVPLPTQKPVMIPLDLWVDGARAGDQRPLLSPEPALFPAELPARRDGDRRAGPLWRGAQGVARHAQPPPHLPVPPHGGRSGSLRSADHRHAGPPRLSPPGGGCRYRPLMATYREERRASDFDHGIEAAVEAVLVSPHFLFAVESDPSAPSQAACIRSAMSIWPPASRSSCGAAFPTKRC